MLVSKMKSTVKNSRALSAKTFSNRFSYFSQSSHSFESSSFKYTRAALKSTFQSSLIIAIWYHLSSHNKEKIAAIQSSSDEVKILINDVDKTVYDLKIKSEKMKNEFSKT